jgi:membrane-associated phospholipid phosphatase
MKRSDALWTAGLAGVTALVLINDQAIQDGAFRSRGNAVYDRMVDIGESLEPACRAGNVLIFWAGGAAVTTALGRGAVEGFFLDGLESHLLTGAAFGSAKVLTGRERPPSGDPYLFWHGGESFPSGHTSVAFELATFVTRRARRTRLAYQVPIAAAAYGLATCMGVQRVDSSEHWPSDVVAGAICGTLVTRFALSRNDERRATLTPVMTDRGVPAGMAIAWRF